MAPVTSLHLLSTLCLCMILSAAQCEASLYAEEALDSIDPNLKDHIKNCEEELKVSVKHCHEQFKKKPDVVPEDCWCFAACVAKKAGVINEKGMILPEKLKKKIEEIKDEKIKKCANKLYEECIDKPEGVGKCSDINNLVICSVMHAKMHPKMCNYDQMSA